MEVCLVSRLLVRHPFFCCPASPLAADNGAGEAGCTEQRAGGGAGGARRRARLSRLHQERRRREPGQWRWR